MYKPKIFLVGDGKDNLTALEETEYMTENVLQDFLEKYPDLLPGDQIEPDNPRRWLLVAREMGIPGDVNESGRWSLDHLFLDQEGIPTFVECKRSNDTRIRREVVAQMLDYAANGTEYWTMERIRQAAAETAQRRGGTLDEEIVKLLGKETADIEVEDYWQQVETNLHNRRVRLVFVADSTPKELRRLVEFLNEEMTNVEVLAVEVKQFQKPEDERFKALVPRVIGVTESARQAKESSRKPTRHTNRQEFLESCPSHIREFFQRVLKLSEEKGYIIYWGQIGFSIRKYSPKIQRPTSFMYAFPPNKFQVYLHADWIYDEKAGELRSALRKFNIFEEGGDYTLTTFVTQENISQMNEIFDFILEQVEKHIEAHQINKENN